MTTREDIIHLLNTNDRAVIRAILAITARQTQDEQANETTKYHNGRGWRPCDARMGCSMAKFYQKNGFLSAKQIAWWRRPLQNGTPRINIYAGQLLKVAQERAA